MGEIYYSPEGHRIVIEQHLKEMRLQAARERLAQGTRRAGNRSSRLRARVGRAFIAVGEALSAPQPECVPVHARHQGRV